jgi:hypothetical protein
MESLDELTKSGSSKKGFFKHVFNFDDESKEDILNIIQYSVLAIVPLVVLNKLMNRFVPEADDDKGSVEILAEIVMQIIVLFIGILIVHRIITYIPPYSGAKYADFSVTTIVLAVLVILLSLQTKLGEKVSILVDRVIELWEGPANNKKNNSKNGKVKVSQPISQNQVAINNSLATTSISQLPTTIPTQSTQKMPDYDSMYRQDTTPLVAASAPSNPYEGFGGIMAANEALGGSGFGSMW